MSFCFALFCFFFAKDRTQRRAETDLMSKSNLIKATPVNIHEVTTLKLSLESGHFSRTSQLYGFSANYDLRKLPRSIMARSTLRKYDLAKRTTDKRSRLVKAVVTLWSIVTFYYWESRSLRIDVRMNTSDLVVGHLSTACVWFNGRCSSAAWKVSPSRIARERVEDRSIQICTFIAKAKRVCFFPA